MKVSSCYAHPVRAVRPLKRRQRGGTTLGILIGIVLGLAIAVVTALVVTRSTLPFVGSSAKVTDKAAVAAAAPATAAVPDAPKPQVPVAAGDLPDPNRTVSRQRPPPGQPAAERREITTVTAATAPVPQAVPEAGGPPPAAGIIPAPGARPIAPSAPGQVVGNAGEGSAPIRAATPSTPPQPSQAALAATGDRGATYLLQAGAFRGVDDADAMKLRLALMGLEAQVITAEVSGSTLYRVRVGPYTGLDAMTRARARLAENGVEATVLRQR